MDKISLLTSFFVLLMLAITLLLYPLRKSKQWLFLLTVFISVGVTAAYQHWGGWTILQDVVKQQKAQKQIQQVLKTPSGAKEVIKNLKERLKDRPNNAQGWYLLGRVYASQAKWVLAKKAYKKAYQLKPEDETIEVNYIQSLWEINERQCNQKIRALFEKLLQKNPVQGDSLAILALDAFQREDYHMALEYWQRLLKILPNGAEEAEVISQAILDTNKRLQALKSNS